MTVYPAGTRGDALLWETVDGPWTVTVIDSNSSGGSDQVIVKVDEVTTVLQEGIDFVVVLFDNTATAAQIASAIDLVSGVSASSVGAVVTVVPDAGTVGLFLSKVSAAAWTVSNGIISGILMLAAAGAIPGLTILASGGFNGPGAGTLKQDANSLDVSWKAPGSATFGEPIDVASGSYVLEDGDDPDKWVRVSNVPAFQAVGAPQALGHLQEQFNAMGQDDVTAAEALAGDVTAFSVRGTNQSGMELVGLLAWLDPAVVGIEISDDAITWVTPTTEGTALSLGNVLPGESVNLYFRRTIGAAAPADPDVLNLFDLSWTGL